MSMDTVLTNLVHQIDEVITVYKHQAPQDAELPYAVVSIIGGDSLYCFDDKSIDRATIQISQYYEWHGDDEDALTDNDDLVNALDREDLGGIIIYRLTSPIVTVTRESDELVLSITQDWRFERMFTLSTTTTEGI